MIDFKALLSSPSRCTAKLSDEFHEHHVGEEKLDGSRYVLYIGGDPYGRRPGNTLLSRRISVIDSKHVDRTENVPHLTRDLYPGLDGTVLDGEIQSADFLATNSIMNSSPSLAVAKQKESGPLLYHVFDVLFFRGRDVRGLPLEKRRRVLEEVVKRMGNKHINPIPQFKGDLMARFRDIVERGGEGIIVKDTRMGYGMGWAKMKKSYDLSTIVTGWKPGNGKYAKQIGSLAVSVLHEGKLVEVGFASGFDDKMRQAMTKNFEKYKGKVLDVFAQEIQDSKRSADNPVGRLRHPTYHRFRDDLNPKEITSKKLLDDLKAAKTKNRRSKEAD